MNSKDRHELESQLRFDVPTPPAGLAERLRAEVPPEAAAALACLAERTAEGAALAAVPTPTTDPKPSADGVAPWWRRPRMLLAAASLAVVGLATAVAIRLAPPGGAGMDRAMTFAEARREGAAAPAGEAAGGGLDGTATRLADAAPGAPSPRLARPPAAQAPAPDHDATARVDHEMAKSLQVEQGQLGDDRRGNLSSERQRLATSPPRNEDLAVGTEELAEVALEGRSHEGGARARPADLAAAAPPAPLQAPLPPPVVGAGSGSPDAPAAAGPARHVQSSMELERVLAETREPGRSVARGPAVAGSPAPKVNTPETRADSRAVVSMANRAPEEDSPARAAEIARLRAQMEALDHEIAAESRAATRPLPVAAPSTGGTAEPNDQPFGDMFFRTSDANPFVDTEEDRLSTFGLDVDTGSYTLARSYLDRGHLPPREAIRVEEWVNAFAALYGDEPPRRDDFALSAEGTPTPFADGERYRLVRFGVRARDLAPAERPAVVLTFVIDVSGSMGQENRLGLLQRSLGLLLDELAPGDRVGVVIYGSEARVLLPHTTDLERVRRAVDALRPEGSTNAEAGLLLGYDLAAAAWRERATNRVVLCSDGVANVGVTGPEGILRRIGEEARRGIELTTIGFGMGNYNDALMERLADQGDGRYAYVDDLAEARRLFVDELAGTLHSIAADAKVQVTFDPRVVERWRLLGYENRDIADERFRDDSVDAGEIGFGHAVTALYEVKLRDDAPRYGNLARLALRYRQLASGEVVEVHRDLAVDELAGRFERARPELRLAAAVAELAELLRGSYWARGSHPSRVVHELAALEDSALGGEPRLRELSDLARRVVEMTGRDRGDGDRGEE